MRKEKDAAKVVDGVIQITGRRRIRNFHRGFPRLGSVPNWAAIPLHRADANSIAMGRIMLAGMRMGTPDEAKRVDFQERGK